MTVLDWGCLEALLIQMGFAHSWIQKVLCCVYTVSYKILANGSHQGNFVLQRRLRQGDLLSPFLFILVDDVLTKLVKRLILVI